MDTEEILARGEERLELLSNRWRELAKEMQEVQTERVELITELRTLTSLMSRLSPVEDAPTSLPVSEDWSTLTLSEAVLGALMDAGVVGPTEVRRILLEHGRDVATPNISATLDYLMRKGLALKIGRGQWAVAATAEMDRMLAGGIQPETDTYQAISDSTGVHVADQ